MPLRRTVDDESAEFCDFLADRQEFLERRRIAIRLELFDTFPLLNNNARFRRFAICCSNRAIRDKDLAAAALIAA